MNAKFLTWIFLGVTSLALIAARDPSLAYDVPDAANQRPPVGSRGSRRRLRRMYGR